MLNTTLIEILKTFSAEEIKWFDEFIRSDYFNKSQRLLNFGIRLRNFSPDYNSISLKREYL